MPGLENDTHPAGGDLLDQLEDAELGACLDCEIQSRRLDRALRRLLALTSFLREERSRQSLEAVLTGEE